MWNFWVRWLLHFNILKNCQIIFWRSCTTLYFHQQCVKVPIFPYLWNTWSYLPFDYSYSSGCEVVSHLVLVCVSLMANNGENLLMCFHWLYNFLKESLSFAHVLIRLLFFSWLSCKSSFVYSGCKYLIRYLIRKHFLTFFGLSFNFLNGIFWNIEL